MTIWNLPSGSTLSTLIERVTVSLELPLANGLTNTVVTLISGRLPNGLRLSGTRIEGTPYQVARDEVSTFVLRATADQGFEDRTFKVIVSGPDNPIWLTPEDLLPVGSNGLYFVLDSSLVDFQLEAIDEDISAGDVLEYYIADGDGELPLGLSLSSTGRITGLVEPILALDQDASTGHFDSNKYDAYPYDFGVLSASGYDSFLYDVSFYDDFILTRPPRKLNRFYQFAVTVSDGDTTTRREFRIYVVGDDFVRADNTVIQVGTGIFTADNTYVRTPIWITPADLGYRRADNYITIFLDTLDTNTTAGVVRYELLPINDDDTVSTLPPGMMLDSISGEIYGRVPYQPAITKEYKFTVNAIRFIGDTNIVTVTGVIYEDELLGKSSIKINKLSTSLADGVNDLASLVDKTIVIGGNDYTVRSTNQSFDDYDILNLTSTLDPQFAINVFEKANIGQDYVFVETLSESQRTQMFGTFIRFTVSEAYEVTDIVPFLTWTIHYNDSSVVQIDPTVDGLDLVSGETFEDSITRVFGSTAVYTINEDNEVRLRIPSNSTNRNRTRIESLFAPSGIQTIEANIISYFDRFTFDVVLARELEAGRNIGIGVFVGDSFSVRIFSAATDETTQPQKEKTFTITILGNVDSTITWITPSDLGTINANFLSTFSIEAQSTVVNSKILYRLVSGRLPPGLTLAHDGEIIGKVRQFGNSENLGLTVFDSSLTIFDGQETTFDRSYTFVAEARDRYGFSAVSKTFTINVFDPNDLLYSNLYLKPFLNSTQRSLYSGLIGNPDIFPPALIYRPNDPEFGLQKEIKVLAYAGIETKALKNYVAVTGLNHRKRKWRLGDIKTAVAKNPGSNDIVYEVVYVDVIDGYEPPSGKARTSYKIKNNGKKITVDSMTYDTSKDIFQTGTGLPEMYINGERVTIEQIYHIINSSDTIITIGDLDIRDVNGNEIDVVAHTDSEPFKYRSSHTPVTADNIGVKVGNIGDNTRYISNLTNMQEQIKSVGETEREFLPLWMRTAQSGSIEEIGYVPALPLCYCVEGGSSQIRLNLINNGFNFNQLHFEIDRYVIDSTIGNSNEQYILFRNYQYNI